MGNQRHESNENEEKVVVKKVKAAGAAKGGRLAISLIMIALGIAILLGGLLLDYPVALRVALVFVGGALMAAFGYVAAGARRVGGTARVPGAELPQDSTTTVRTTVKKQGFPKKGRSPLETATETEEPAAAQTQDADPDSGTG
jgi:hypothetical protein